MIADVPRNWLAVQPLSNKSIKQQAQKAAEVFLETPQATVLNKQKFYIVKPKQGEALPTQEME